MKICVNRNTLGGLVNERLAAIGASNIPASARQLIEGEALRACERTIQRTITGPRVGRAVAAALSPIGDIRDTQGSKGAVAPLASSGFEPKAQNHVAGPATDTSNQGDV